MTSRRNKRSSQLTGSMLGGYSDRSRVRLKYALQTALTSIVTTGSFDYVMRGNSVFDPDFSGTGGQPTNFDDWAAVYNNYKVWSSTLTVKPMVTNSGTEPTLWAVGPRHISTALTVNTQMDFITQPYVVANEFNIYRSGAKDSHFSMHMSTTKFLGLTSGEFEGRDDLAAAVGANPALPWYWHISATNIDTGVTSEVAALIMIEYDVEFFNRVDTTIDEKYERLLNLNRPEVKPLTPGVKPSRSSGQRRFGGEYGDVPETKETKTPNKSVRKTID
jgi:hypothetical protein